MYCEVTSAEIDLLGLLDRVRSDKDGAIVLFCGVVRNQDAGRAVVGITYESYESMATEKLREICEEVAAQFEAGEIAVVHRVGELGVGEPSVGIAVAAPHRDAAYKASREVIERLKREVPIWKREHYVDGADVWVTGFDPPPSGAD